MAMTWATFPGSSDSSWFPQAERYRPPGSSDRLVSVPIWERKLIGRSASKRNVGGGYLMAAPVIPEMN